MTKKQKGKIIGAVQEYQEKHGLAPSQKIVRNIVTLQGFKMSAAREVFKNGVDSIYEAAGMTAPSVCPG